MFARMGRWPARQRLLTRNSMEVNSIWKKSRICQAEAESGCERGACIAVRHGSSERISIPFPQFQAHPANSIREYTKRKTCSALACSASVDLISCNGEGVQEKHLSTMRHKKGGRLKGEGGWLREGH